MILLVSPFKETWGLKGLAVWPGPALTVRVCYPGWEMGMGPRRGGGGTQEPDRALPHHCWSPGAWRPPPATHRTPRADLASSSSSRSTRGSSWMDTEGGLGLSSLLRVSPMSPGCPGLGHHPSARMGSPGLAPASPNRIMVQVLQGLHILIKVDVHGEGCVCVVC